MFKGKRLAMIAFSSALEEAAGCRRTVAFRLQTGTMDTTGVSLTSLPRKLSGTQCKPKAWVACADRHGLPFPLVGR